MLVTHMFVHGATSVTSDRYVLADDGNVVVGGPVTRDKAWERDAGLFASHSMLLAARAACAIFGWPEPEKLETLLNVVLNGPPPARTKCRPDPVSTPSTASWLRCCSGSRQT